MRLCSPSSRKWYRSTAMRLWSWEGNREPGRKLRHPTDGFMINVEFASESEDRHHPLRSLGLCVNFYRFNQFLTTSLPSMCVWVCTECGYCRRRRRRATFITSTTVTRRPYWWQTCSNFPPPSGTFLRWPYRAGWSVPVCIDVNVLERCLPLGLSSLQWTYTYSGWPSPWTWNWLPTWIAACFKSRELFFARQEAKHCRWVSSWACDE